MKSSVQIAIDGPAGAGKSTIAKLLAQELGYIYIDSGAMYRAVTLYMLNNDLFEKGDSLVKKHLTKMKIEFKTKNKSSNQLITLNGKDISKKIRSTTVSSRVSEVAAKKIVRTELVKRQKLLGGKSSMVMDGRDIGTVVFPKADLKIYLTASAEIRAKRRSKDLKKLGEKVSLQKLVQQIKDRDNYDSSRKESPLTKAQDAVVIDCTKLSIPQVIEKITLLLN